MQSLLGKSAVILLATIGTALTAGPTKFDGKFVDKKFLNGNRCMSLIRAAWHFIART
jgi:hypothetical protein